MSLEIPRLTEEEEEAKEYRYDGEPEETKEEKERTDKWLGVLAARSNVIDLIAEKPLDEAEIEASSGSSSSSDVKMEEKYADDDDGRAFFFLYFFEGGDVSLSPSRDDASRCLLLQADSHNMDFLSFVSSENKQHVLLQPNLTPYA